MSDTLRNAVSAANRAIQSWKREGYPMQHAREIGLMQLRADDARRAMAFDSAHKEKRVRATDDSSELYAIYDKRDRLVFGPTTEAMCRNAITVPGGPRGEIRKYRQVGSMFSADDRADWGERPTEKYDYDHESPEVARAVRKLRTASEDDVEEDPNDSYDQYGDEEEDSEAVYNLTPVPMPSGEHNEASTARRKRALDSALRSHDIAVRKSAQRYIERKETARAFDECHTLRNGEFTMKEVASIMRAKRER